MVEITVEADEDYTGDVEIDFGKITKGMSALEKGNYVHTIMEAVLKGEKYTFEEVELNFNGEVTLNVDPNYKY